MKEAAIYVSPKELKPWLKNPRKNEPAVKNVIASIERFGFGAPIVANKNGEVIAGHTRLKAALVMGLETIPVRYLDFSDEEAHKLSLADNKLSEIADWNEEVLETLLANFDESEKSLLGFDDKKNIVDTSVSMIEEIDDMKPEFYVIFRGPLDLQADLIQRLQALISDYPDIRIEPGL